MLYYVYIYYNFDLLLLKVVRMLKHQLAELTTLHQHYVPFTMVIMDRIQ